MHKALLTLLMAVTLLLAPGISGCYNRLEIQDSVGITGFGADIDGDLKVFSAQVAMPSGQPEGDKPAAQETYVISEKGTGYAQAGRQVFLHFPRTPLWSLASTIVVSEKAAREDISLFMDFFSRNRFIRPNVLMFISMGTSPEEVMRTKMPPEEYSLIALEKMIKGQENQTGLYVPVTLREFREKYATPGVEPVIPQVEIISNGGEKILNLNGVAVFRGRQMVGSLNESESRGYRYLRPNVIQGGLFTIRMPDSPSAQGDPISNVVTLELVRSAAETRVQVDGGQVNIHIIIHAEGNLYDQNSTVNWQTTEGLQLMEQMGSQAMQQDVQACIQKSQSLQSDIFGWGVLLKGNSPATWDQLQEDWPQQFANIHADIEVSYSIRRTYLTEQPVQVAN